MAKKTFGDFLKMLTVKGLVVESNLMKAGENQVEYISYNSKNIKPGTMFVAKGRKFHTEYLQEAFDNGAFCYVAETVIDNTKPYIVINDMREALTDIGSFFWDEIWNEKLQMVGITGTKGKSTTATFVKAIIDDYCAKNGLPEAGFCSGIYNFDGKEKVLARKMTTPETLELHEILASCAESGLKYHVMETSSQALKYKRTQALKYKVGAFITFGRDHIHEWEHPTIEDYFASKLIIFQQSEIGCVNLELDEPYRSQVLEAAKKGCKKVYTYGRVEGADYYGYDVVSTPKKLSFKLKCEGKVEDIEVAIGGFYNTVNALCAISIARALDIPFENVKAGLAHAHVAGRMEVFEFKDKDVEAVVDAAHNTLSGETFMTNIRQLYPDRKIMMVFGASGDKAFNRRKDLGTIANKYASKVILTEHDPATEKVADICAQIAEWIDDEKIYGVIENRKEAILKACEIIEPGWVLIVMGNGPDAYQKRGTILYEEMTDAEIVQSYIEAHQ